MYLSIKNLWTLEKLYHTMLDNSLVEVRIVGDKTQSKKVTINFVDYENLLEELGDMISTLENNRKDSNEKTSKYIAEKRKINKDYGRGDAFIKERDRKRMEKIKKLEAIFPSIRERGERFDRELQEKRKGENQNG
jgi:hypothetical protein